MPAAVALQLHELLLLLHHYFWDAEWPHVLVVHPVHVFKPVHSLHWLVNG